MCKCSDDKNTLQYCFSQKTKTFFQKKLSRQIFANVMVIKISKRNLTIFLCQNSYETYWRSLGIYLCNWKFYYFFSLAKDKSVDMRISQLSIFLRCIGNFILKTLSIQTWRIPWKDNGLDIFDIIILSRKSTTKFW